MNHAMSSKARAERTRVLNLARDLARSGRYLDHRSIFAHLEGMHGFGDARNRLQTLRSQLDHLCALAQPGRARIDIPGRQRPENEAARSSIDPASERAAQLIRPS
jgi:hypothetical protein